MDYDLRSFLFVNELSQKDVAEFLGVSKGQMSKLVSNTARLQLDQLEKLLTNDRGWDTKCLSNPLIPMMKPTKSEGNNATTIQALRAENEMLRAQLAEEKARAAEYWEMIKEISRK